MGDSQVEFCKKARVQQQIEQRGDRRRRGTWLSCKGTWQDKTIFRHTHVLWKLTQIHSLEDYKKKDSRRNEHTLGILRRKGKSERKTRAELKKRTETSPTSWVLQLCHFPKLAWPVPGSSPWESLLCHTTNRAWKPVVHGPKPPTFCFCTAPSWEWFLHFQWLKKSKEG